MQMNPEPTPMPSEPAESSRWSEGRRRRRLLDGGWQTDLSAQIVEQVGPERWAGWGHRATTGLNPFGTLCRELSVLYDQAPDIRHDIGAESIRYLTEGVRYSGLYGLMARVQQYVIGLRECLVRVDVNPAGRPSYRPVYPDMVVAWARPDAPDLPVTVWELRRRTHPETRKSVWTLDVLDISDVENPIYEVRECGPGVSLGADLSEHFLGGHRSGESYPYRRSDGRPLLPYVLYHAERTGDRLFDPYRWSELVESTYSAATKANFIDHVYMQASWPRLFFLGCAPVGAHVEPVAVEPGQGAPARRTVTRDPAGAILLEQIEGYSGQPDVKQLPPGGQVDVMSSVLADELARIASDAGVPASDLQRLNSQRSGVSIALTNEGKRVQQRRFSAQFRDSDERLIALTACLINRQLGTNLPESGYAVIYRELPLSPDELKARRENVLELLRDGLISRKAAYIEMNPGMSVAQAEAELAEIDAERAPPTPIGDRVV